MGDSINHGNDRQNDGLEANNEVGFLYKKCKKIKPFVISEMALVPEFNEAIKEYKGDINDEIVYRLISKKFREMCYAGKKNKTPTNVMKKISSAVTGNPLSWIFEDEFMRFLCSKCEKISPIEVSVLVQVPEYVEAIKQYDGDINDDVIYNIVYGEFRKMLDNNSLRTKAKGVMNRISRAVKGDSHAWQKEQNK